MQRQPNRCRFKGRVSLKKASDLNRAGGTIIYVLCFLVADSCIILAGIFYSPLLTVSDFKAPEIFILSSGRDKGSSIRGPLLLFQCSRAECLLVLKDKSILLDERPESIGMLALTE
jgi:hypothetical protein